MMRDERCLVVKTTEVKIGDLILSLDRVSNVFASRQTRKIGPSLARLRVHWPNLVPYIGIHWTNFSGLSGLLRQLLKSYKRFFTITYL